MKHKVITFVVLTIAAATSSAAQWQKVTDTNELKSLFSDTTMEATLTDGVKSSAVFNADGTGELTAWGDKFHREWKVENQQACVLIDEKFQCFSIEKHIDKTEEYRVTQLDTGATNIIKVAGVKFTIASAESKKRGGAAQPTAEEIAAKLSNPTSPVMTIGNNIDFVRFDGDAEGADSQSATRYVFQTTFPFTLKDDKGVIFFRPAIPVFFNEPVPQGAGEFSSEGTDLGDIGYDLSFGRTEKSGLLWGTGMVGTIPTASNDILGKKLWAAGPELLLGKIGKWGVVGGLLSHQWDFAGSGQGEINNTGLSYFYAFPLGGGWQFAAGPNISYDHTKEKDNLTLPLGVGIAKTTILMGRPWKFHLQYWNYVKRSDEFAPVHQLRISISPVVSAPWNK